MSKDHNFVKGDYVFAKVRGYPAWPARIEEILDPRPATLKYNVFFFGTSETAAVQAKEVYPYLPNKEKYGKTIKRKFFNEGIQELEEELNRLNNGGSVSIKDSTTKLNTANNDEQHEVDKKVISSNEAEPVVVKRKRKVSDAVKSVDNDGETSAKRRRKSTAKDKAEEARSKRKRVSGDTYEVVEDDNLGDSKDPNSDKRRLSSNKVLKPKPDGSSDNIDQNDGEGRKRKRSSLDADSIALKEQISRSGRRIKPKKFLDDDENEEDVDNKGKSGKGKLIETETKDSDTGGNVSGDASETPKKSEQVTTPKKGTSKDASTPNKKASRLSDMGRLIWVRATTGDMVQIKIDHTLPDSVKSVRHRAQYDAQYEAQLKQLKEKIENGEVCTPEIKNQLKPSPDALASMTEKEIELQKNRRLVERKYGRTRWLKLESKLVTLDVFLRSALQKEKAEVELALEYLDEYITLPIDPLMLLKNPQLVETVKNLLKYIGNAQHWKYTSEEATEFNRKALKIRQKAMTLFHKFRTIFAIPKRADFWFMFNESLDRFKDATKLLSPDLLYELTLDPSSPYYNDVAECDREDREHDLKLEASFEASELKENTN